MNKGEDILLIKYLITAHQEGNAPNISPLLCFIGYGFSTLEKPVQSYGKILSQNYNLIDQKVLKDIDHTIQSIFFTFMTCGAFLHLLPGKQIEATLVPTHLIH
ncbi:hypothetical protein [Simkania sp.]|uniref:hypothetical protein n=1 Tax=Simkania sp. TaxID=34094 RepID=UPI003B52FB3E